MRIIQAIKLKRSSWLFFTIGILLLLRYEVIALIGPWTFLSRTTRTTTISHQQDSLGRHQIHLPLISLLRQKSFDDDDNDDNNEVDGISSSDLDETRNIVRDQQEKIDMLMKLVAASSDSNTASSPSTKSVPATNRFGNNDDSTQFIQKTQRLQRQPPPPPVQSSSPTYTVQPVLPPLKAMMFIDGTWFYYSMYERERACPIKERFGRGWQFKYNVVWENIPRIVCQALQERDVKKGWSSQTMMDGQNIARPIEVTRASVYTSYKADTAVTSNRYKMFQEMDNAGFEVLRMETVGRGEKCVDIQLAVDMLHFATVPDAYDVAILLTGDKDFMPAMGRCRQKGRRMALVSMRNACNKYLYDGTANLLDFDVVWLDDHIDQFIQPKRENEMRRRNASVSEFALIKIVRDFIASSGLPRVSSRDIGKYLKIIYIGERCILDEVKEIYGGLYQFLHVTEVFLIEKEPTETAFWVASREISDTKLRRLKSNTIFTDDEKSFFEGYDTSILVDERDKFYHHSIDVDDWPSDEQFVSTTTNNNPLAAATTNNSGRTPVSSPDYTSLTVVKLKEICRERKLHVSGKKADLIQRITEEDDRLREQSSAQTIVESSPESYLDGLISEFLQVKGGEASSRDVGRYLLQNKASEQRRANERDYVSALEELKELHESLKKYIVNSDLFERVEIDKRDRENFEFLVRFAKQ